ncbi:hypothetical protein ACSVDA_16535 [Cytobacillus sp. Hm23]
MNIFIKKSDIQYKNPVLGRPTRIVEEHYHSRRILADVDENEKVFQFTKDELPFAASENQMIEAIEAQLNEVESNA